MPPPPTRRMCDPTGAMIDAESAFPLVPGSQIAQRNGKIHAGRQLTGLRADVLFHLCDHNPTRGGTRIIGGSDKGMIARTNPAPADNAGPTPQFLRYLGAIRSFVSKRVHPDDLDDVVQDVALKMHQRAGRAGIENFEGYLFQVARSVLADHGRRRRSGMAALHDPIEAHHHPAEMRLPDRIVEHRQELRTLLGALESLPPRCRQAIVLHRFEHMNYADIAGHMGISVSAVEKHIMRAIRHLTACREK